MKKRFFFILIISCLLFHLAKGGVIGGKENIAENTKSQLRGNGMQFIENKGQVVNMNNQAQPDVLYSGDGGAMKVYLRKGGVSYVLNKTEKVEENEHQFPINSEQYVTVNSHPQTIQLQRIDLDFVGSKRNATVLNTEKVEGYFNYYLSHCPKGITNINGYNKVVYQNVYNNIDIAFYGGKEKGLKYDIIVKPGGNANDIKLKYTGADGIEIRNGELRIKTALEDMTETLPKVYQNIDGKIVDVKAQYRLEGTTVRLQLKTYNSQLPLIIDPWVTYYGGDTRSKGIAVDKNGNTVIVGSILSNALPVTPGAFQTVLANVPFPGVGDAFIGKFDSNGNHLWSTYYGGSALDADAHGRMGIATDSGDSIVITGSTYSSDFPVTQGAFQTDLRGNPNAFVVKLDPDGKRLWATYYGGTSSDDGIGVATDHENNVVITGTTNSLDFPVTAGAFQTAAGGGTVPDGHAPASDVFVVKFDPLGVRLWSTYYGAFENGEGGLDIATDLGNNIVITGITNASNFPVSPGAFQTFFGGISDAFVLKFDKDGNRLWATYYGGNNSEAYFSIATDSGNNIVITGNTSSPDFPVTQGAFQTLYGGGSADDFVVKLEPVNGFPIWSTYYGTAGYEMECFCSISEKDNIYILTETGEEHEIPGIPPGTPSFPCAYQKDFAGFEDQTIAKFSPAGNHLCDTYLGGEASDDLDNGGGSIACYKDFIYMAICTDGPGYPVTPGAFQNSYMGNASMAVAKLCGISCGDTLLVTDFTKDQSTICANTQVNYTSSVLHACESFETTYLWTFPGGTPATSTQQNPTGIIFSSPGNFPVKLKITTPCETDSVVKPMAVVAGLTAQISGISNICTGNSVTLSAMGGTTYLWNTGTTATTITVSLTSATTYSLTAFSGGCSATAVHTVSINALPIITATSNTVVCYGGNANLLGGGASNYVWQPGSIAGNSISITATSNSTYTVTGTDDNGCVNTAVITLTLNPLPLLTVTSNTAICHGATITLSASGVNNYSWNTGDVSNNIQISPTITTTYTLTGTDNNGCSNTALVTVTVNPLPVLTVTSNTTICNGTTITLSASGANNYSWNTGDVSNNLQISPTITTSYTVTGIDLAGCISTAQINITVNQYPQLTTSNDTSICQGQNVTLTASGGSSYSWSTGDNTPGITITPDNTGSYTVTAANGPCWSINTITVTVLPIPTADAGNDTTISSGDNLHLSGSGGGTYNWSPTTGLSCATCPNPTVSPQTTTTYYLTVTDVNGCTSADTVIITVELICGDLFVPTAFSPNDDGQNDFLEIREVTCISTLTFTIYNRWGEIVFKTSDATKTWDGFYNGQIMETAVFAYSINATLVDGKEVIKNGNILLIR